VGDHLGLNAQLAPGAVTPTVTVEASTTPVQTTSAAQPFTITGTQIRELELNNRNFEQLVTLQPGVANGLPAQVGFGIENTDSTSVNGARTSANNRRVDGSDINDTGSNSTLLNVPSVDALAEFKLQRGTYDAEYGRSGGGQVNVVTRSGTSEFHGDAYEYAAGIDWKLPGIGYSRRNGGEPQSHLRVASPTTSSIPHASGLRAECLLEVHAQCNAAAACARTGWLVGQYIVPESALNNYRQEILPVDQKIMNKIQVFGRYMQDNLPTTEPGGLFAGSGLPGISSTSTNAPGRNIVAHVTMSLSPSLLNEAAFNYSWGAINSNITGVINNPTFVSGLNETSFPYKDPYGRVPGVSISGVQGVGIPVSPYFARNIDKQVYDNVTIVRGNHSIRTGATLQYLRKSENAVNPTNGSFTFNSVYSGGGYNQAPFANFLLGDAYSFSQASRDIIPTFTCQTSRLTSRTIGRYVPISR
jgi:hypothetical protein